MLWVRRMNNIRNRATEIVNNTMYVWNSSVPKVFVYFKTEEAASAGAEGSSFTWGYPAIGAGAGLLIGAVGTAVCMTAARKKKKDKTESA